MHGILYTVKAILSIHTHIEAARHLIASVELNVKTCYTVIYIESGRYVDNMDKCKIVKFSHLMLRISNLILKA